MLSNLGKDLVIQKEQKLFEIPYKHIDGLMQEKRNALELRLFCTNPSI